jgi:hypothetical protein
MLKKKIKLSAEKGSQEETRKKTLYKPEKIIAYKMHRLELMSKSLIKR